VLLPDVLGLLENLGFRFVLKIVVGIIVTLLLKSLLFLLESGQSGLNIRINEVIDIFAIKDLLIARKG
jgi:hypothetical protein